MSFDVSSDYEQEIAMKGLMKTCYSKAELLCDDITSLFKQNPISSPFIYGELIGDKAYIKISAEAEQTDLLYGDELNPNTSVLLSPITLQELYLNNNDKGYIQHYIARNISEWVSGFGFRVTIQDI